MTEYRWADCTELNKLIEEYGARRIMVVDCETTGLDTYDYSLRHRNYILQLSVISAEKSMILDQYFKPKIREWPEAERINGIGPEMVKDAPRFSSMLPEVQGIFDRAKVLIGYNLSFDLGFLRDAGIDIDHTEVLIDVMEDFAAWKGDLHPYYNTYTWKKLTYAAKVAGYEWDVRAHNSLGDCYATLHVAKWLQKQNIEKGWKPEYPEWYGEEGYCE